MALQVQIAVPGSDKKIPVNTGLFINNEFVAYADSQETIKYVLYHRTRQIVFRVAHPRMPFRGKFDANLGGVGW